MIKSNPCPICECHTVIVTHDAGLDLVYPECYQCGYRGNKTYKEHMIIKNVEQEFKLKSRDPEKKQELLNFAYDLWNEVIGMEKMESDPDYYGEDDYLKDIQEEHFDHWVPVEDLIDDSEK